MAGDTNKFMGTLTDGPADVSGQTCAAILEPVAWMQHPMSPTDTQRAASAEVTREVDGRVLRLPLPLHKMHQLLHAALC